MAKRGARDAEHWRGRGQGRAEGGPAAAGRAPGWASPERRRRAYCGRREQRSRSEGGGWKGRGEGRAGPRGTPPWVVLGLTEGKPCGGKRGRPCAGVSSRAAHPAGGAASPLSPGSAASRGRPASQLSGPRAASRRLRHLRANAPQQPGPTTAPTGGRRRAALAVPPGSPLPPGRAAARRGAGQPHGPLQ